uniref:EARP complex and GARP complex interacting protein 1 n=1 Tax=Pipistrellus kuhlii TaxID=59472 RepID=A0A7J7R2I5_PIPKU|nr:EARP complex and GARP complex interacting protein 1 [Pipistrellus kuhlii]
MEDDAPVIYGLEFQARALTPQTAETDAIRFLVGTQSLKYDNQIHIIDFDDENNIINKNVLLHQVGEIWHISASPADKGVLATCYSKTFLAKHFPALCFIFGQSHRVGGSNTPQAGLS